MAPPLPPPAIGGPVKPKQLAVLPPFPPLAMIDPVTVILVDEAITIAPPPPPPDAPLKIVPKPTFQRLLPAPPEPPNKGSSEVNELDAPKLPLPDTFGQPRLPPPGPWPTVGTMEPSCVPPFPPANPPGPPAPPGLISGPVNPDGMPPAPFRLIVPAMATSPVANIVTGVLVLFWVKVTVTPDGMLTVVKLKTPLGGSVTVVLAVGTKAPSAPVLP